MKIKTNYDPKPIPDRSTDWSACDVEVYDCDCDELGYFSLAPIGYGATEAQAIADLKEQLEDEDL